MKSKNSSSAVALIFFGFLNSDYFPRLSDAICLDTTNTYLFEDETFDYIFSEHMIEHVPI